MDKAVEAARDMLAAMIKDFGDPDDYPGDDGPVAAGINSQSFITFKMMRDWRDALTAADAARAVATREAVEEWLNEMDTLPLHQRLHRTDFIIAALSHFAPPASNAPILRMSVEEIEKEMRLCADVGDNAIHIPSRGAARVAHRLAQPVPAVDPDAAARAAYETWWKAKSKYPGDIPTQHWPRLSEGDKEGWRAVAAAAEKGNG